MSEEACQLVCDGDDRCNFFFWSIDNSCAMFKTCDRVKNDTNPGTIYAKNGLCSGITQIFPLLQTLVFSKILPLVKNKFSRKSTFYISDKTKEKWPKIKCSDGIKGQDETGVDCGGPCKPCGNINNILNE